MSTLTARRDSVIYYIKHVVAVEVYFTQPASLGCKWRQKLQNTQEIH